MLSSTQTVAPPGIEGWDAVDGAQPAPSVPTWSNHTRPLEIWNLTVVTSWPRSASGELIGTSSRVHVPVDGSAPRLKLMIVGSEMLFAPQYTDTFRYADSNVILISAVVSHGSISTYSCTLPLPKLWNSCRSSISTVCVPLPWR